MLQAELDRGVDRICELEKLLEGEHGATGSGKASVQVERSARPRARGKKLRRAPRSLSPSARRT